MPLHVAIIAPCPIFMAFRVNPLARDGVSAIQGGSTLVMNKMETKEPIILLGAVTDRRLAALRVILAAAGLLIIYLIPAEPDPYTATVYYTLGAYIAYSLFVYNASRSRINFPSHLVLRLVWADLAWYTILVALTDGVNSPFFFFYLFAIIVVASRVRFPSGLMVTSVSAALCVLMLVLAPPEGPIDMARVAMRPLTIVGL